MQKKNNNYIFVILSLVIITIIYLLISVVRLFIKPTETTIVKNGELTKYEEVVGYIVRDETLLDNSKFDGIMQNYVEDSTRVSKESVVATYVSKSENSLMKKVEELDDKIEEAMQSQQTIYSPDAKALEANIQIQLFDMIKDNTDLTVISESKTKLNNDIKKKAQIVGELSPVGSKLKELINERASYEKQINDSKKELIAPLAGLVSYRVDGFEEVLEPRNISRITSDQLNSLKLNTNQIVTRNTSRIKIINNFECYILVLMNSPESLSANLNDKLYLRFDNLGGKLIPATIEYITEEAGGRLMALKITSNVEDLTKYRKINLDVVWWNYKGLKVHKSVLSQTDILDENGSIKASLNSVLVKKAGSEDKVFVKVVKEFGDYAIVDNYTEDEFSEMGFTKEEIASFSTLKLYNEVVIGNVK